MADHLSRRDALQYLGWAGMAAALSLCPQAGAKRTRKPNIVYIMSDDHAAHAIGCYGSRINQTPNIDRIAQEGVRFDNCFCTNAICGPSRAVILTGKYSHLNGFRTNSDRFDGSQTTFPKVLQAAGYRTGLVGKWHLQSDPTGFDYWNILPGQGEYIDPVLIEMGEKKKHQGYVTDVITDSTIDFIKRCGTDTFCVMCHHKAPHRNWIPDAKHADMYADTKIPIPKTYGDDYANRATPARRAEMRVDRDMTPSDLKKDPPSGLEGGALRDWKYQRYMEDYLRVIASVDDNVGRLLAFLDEQKLAENTLVVYASDQGFFLGDHGWFDKRFMYEESLRMPLLMRFPGQIAPKTTNKDLVQNVDFAPTFIDVAGASIPGEMQGRSIQPLFKGQAPKDWRKTIYYEYFEYPAVHSVIPHSGVRNERYKLIHYLYKDEVDEWELFDLEKDPHELRSVYADPAYASVQQDLKTELERLRRELKVDAT